MVQFGNILAELRRARQLTQKDLAQIMHVSVSTISNYETGIHFPDMEQLSELADFFQVTTDYLLGRTTANLPIELDIKSESVRMALTRARKAAYRLLP